MTGYSERTGVILALLDLTLLRGVYTRLSSYPEVLQLLPDHLSIYNQSTIHHDGVVRPHRKFFSSLHQICLIFLGVAGAEAIFSYSFISSLPEWGGKCVEIPSWEREDLLLLKHGKVEKC